MYSFKRIIWYGVVGAVGIVLVVLSVCNILSDFWCGFGGGLIGVSVIRLLLSYRYRTNENYAAKVDLNVSDERNKFLSDKAKVWAFYFSFLLLGLGALILKMIGQAQFSQFCCYAVCGMIAIYWIAYLFVNKKY